MVALYAVAACLLVALSAAAGVAALESGNLAYLSPVVELPGLAKDEPVSALAHSRSLLSAHGHKHQDPAKSAWESRTKRNRDTVFAQGVASGDPFAKSVILWTRVTPPSGAAKKPAFLDYCVSKDRKFSKCVARGTTITDAAVDFTAKVEARKLKPNTKYFYQWRYRQNDRAEPVYSPIGRTRTIPRADDDIGRMRIAYFSCSDLTQGYFTAYGQIARMAQNNEIDITMHIGDYIYEYGTNGSDVNIPDPVQRASRNHKPNYEILSLNDYRTRYNQYNTDVDTKAMRASAPLIPVWDDHEYANNAWTGGADNHQPATEGDWNERRLRALQVYYEQMPIRQANVDNKQQIYRSFEIGKLIKLIMLDTRIIGRNLQNFTDRLNPNRTILGAPQQKFLFDQLSEAQGSQTWKILGQQVIFARVCGATAFFDDIWEGYRQSQYDVLDYLSNNKIDNTVVLTGDIHTHWAFELPKFPCKNEPGYNESSRYAETGEGSLAVEFVSSSITSNYYPLKSQVPFTATLDALKSINPHVKYLESWYKGFAVLDIRRKHITSNWYFAPDLQRPGQYATMVQGESWRVNAGTSKLVKVG